MVAGVLTVALVVALGAWVFNGDDAPSAGAAPRATTAAQSAAASASAAARASQAAAAERASARKAAVAALPAKLDAILGGGGNTWSLATLDLTTGATTNLGAASGMYTGSIIKVTLLENLLRTQGGVANLSSFEQSEAAEMITESDNDAALAVWNAGGGDAPLQQTVALLGLKDTVIAPDGYFGISTTSAADQLKVLDELVTPTFLTAADVAYVNGLMANVVPDQRWGAPTMADPGSVTENKNGWLDNDADNGAWLINSLGIVTIGGQRYLVAALSQHHPDFDTGVQRLNAALAAVAATLR